MLPIRLELRNFLAYRAPDPINLEDLHLACLSGANGAGKSSLLDAITWVLWGKARAKSDDDLVHMGEREMSVSLDFWQNQHLYRVIRKRKIGNPKAGGGRAAGQSELNLFGWEADKNHFALISEPSMRETQFKINSLLHLDYDIFTHSAFLQQGRADSFTLKSPTERKKILSDILGLDRWELYQDEVKTKLQEIQTSLAVNQQLIFDVEMDIAREPALQAELDIAREQAQSAQLEVNLAQASLDEVAGADLELKRVNELLAGVEYSIQERQRDLVEIEKQIIDHENKATQFETVLEQQNQIQAGMEQLEAARAADLELGDKLRALNDLNQQIANLDKQIGAARQSLELELRQLETEIQQDERIIDTAEAVQTAMGDLSAQILELENLEHQREAHLEEIGRLNEQRAELEGANKGIHQEGEDLKERIQLLEASTEPRCPICQQPLNEKQKANLLAEMNEQLENLRATYRQNTQTVRDYHQTVKDLQAETKNISNHVKDLPRLRSQQGGYEQQIKEAYAADARLQARQAHWNERQQILESGQFALELRTQLAESQALRDELGYSEDEHDSIRQQMKTFIVFQAQAQALEVARQALPETQAALEKDYQRRTRYQQNIAEYEIQAETYHGEADGLLVKVETMHLRQAELDTQRSLLRNAEEKVIALQQELRAIDYNRKRRDNLLAERDQLATDENTYEQLRAAFGRNGIPAMLIEAAIPELEEAANRILSRMTNNRMHLRFDTQRERKTGGVIETFDILIADELGTRDYGLYSGGEAFRVNFAIRIALSQLLTRRAGAQLRTLFIDEGFGTQDELGRERLVEAISAIQEDFDLVLVITHIEELRDLFPARIEITKTSNGSMAVVR